MAGLPKAVSIILISLGLVFSLVAFAAGQELQTGSVVLPPGGIQTASNVLQPAFDFIDGNLNADPVDQQTLKGSFQTAADLLLITVDQALAMLNLVHWGTLVESDALANAAAFVETVLADLIAGTLAGDPVAALQQLLNYAATPAGTLNAIGRAGASDEILNQVAVLVAGGVPPGIVVRITKEGLRNGFSMEEIEALLDELAEGIASGEEISWGQIANAITDKGNQSEEVAPGEETGEPEPEVSTESEQEENEQGNSGNDDNPGQGNSGNDDNPGQGNGNDDNPGQGNGNDKDKKNDK